MKTLPLRLTSAKKAASIGPEESSRLLHLDPKQPTFELLDPDALPPDDPWPAPSHCDVPAMYRAASRRAVHAYGSRLRCSPYVQVWFIALDLNCNDIGRACVAQGGLTPVEITLPDLLVRARSLKAEGILLMQNRPGPVESGVVIDAYPTIRIAVACELLGLPLIEHIYLNALGYPMFMRERGVLKEVPTLLSTVREGSEGMAVKAWEQGLGDEE